MREVVLCGPSQGTVFPCPSTLSEWSKGAITTARESTFCWPAGQSVARARRDAPPPGAGPKGARALNRLVSFAVGEALGSDGARELLSGDIQSAAPSSDWINSRARPMGAHPKPTSVRRGRASVTSHELRSECSWQLWGGLWEERAIRMRRFSQGLANRCNQPQCSEQFPGEAGSHERCGVRRGTERSKTGEGAGQAALPCPSSKARDPRHWIEGVQAGPTERQPQSFAFLNLSIGWDIFSPLQANHQRNLQAFATKGRVPACLLRWHGTPSEVKTTPSQPTFQVKEGGRRRQDQPRTWWLAQK